MCNPTLFEMDKLEQAVGLVGKLEVERPLYEPGLLLGTSAFTAAGYGKERAERERCQNYETSQPIVNFSLHGDGISIGPS